MLFTKTGKSVNKSSLPPSCIRVRLRSSLSVYLCPTPTPFLPGKLSSPFRCHLVTKKHHKKAKCQLHPRSVPCAQGTGALGESVGLCPRPGNAWCLPPTCKQPRGCCEAPGPAAAMGAPVCFILLYINTGMCVRCCAVSPAPPTGPVLCHLHAASGWSAPHKC